jgi:SAM-dependent methyltransferase
VTAAETQEVSAGELQAWFANIRNALETAYLAHDEPWKQSGMSGPAERWAALRKPIADCLEHSGSFLDIGCANGYLLESCLAWTAERNIVLEPYGIDLSPRLVALAQRRLPLFASHMVVANAFEWLPPQRFDYVRTELVYVPAAYEKQYVERLLAHYLKPDGRLLVANYMEGDPNPARGLLPGSHPTRHIVMRLQELGVHIDRHHDGYDPVTGARTRVAVIARAYKAPAHATEYKRAMPDE